MFVAYLLTVRQSPKTDLDNCQSFQQYALSLLAHKTGGTKNYDIKFFVFHYYDPSPKNNMIRVSFHISNHWLEVFYETYFVLISEVSLRDKSKNDTRFVWY